METIKLVKLISTFSPHEFKNFGKFIRSSFFNESKKIITYYNFLKSYYPDFKIDNETIQLVYSKIYKNEKFNKKKIRDLSYQLEKLAEDYLGSLMVMQESLDFKRYSLMQISKRKLDLHFESKSREIEKLLNKIKFKDNSYFFISNCNGYPNAFLTLGSSLFLWI